MTAYAFREMHTLSLTIRNDRQYRQKRQKTAKLPEVAASDDSEKLTVSRPSEKAFDRQKKASGENLLTIDTDGQKGQKWAIVSQFTLVSDDTDDTDGQIVELLEKVTQ